MKRRNVQELARASYKNDGNDAGGSHKAEELETYRQTPDYNDNSQPNEVKVDMANQPVRHSSDLWQSCAIPYFHNH